MAENLTERVSHCSSLFMAGWCINWCTPPIVALERKRVGSASGPPLYPLSVSGFPLQTSSLSQSAKQPLVESKTHDTVYVLHEWVSYY